MSPGSEPERDDTGLPPVDIEIPDDARELDPDVQAYRREQRALRRQQRQSRWHRSLGKDGIVLPLLACCLILALIAGTLLTVFAATSYPGVAGGVAGSGTNSTLPTGPAGLAPQLVTAGPLPAGDITVDGRAQPLDTLHQAMLVLVPQHCNCVSTLAWLADVAVSAHATAAYVVYNQQTRAQAERLYGQLETRDRQVLTLADDGTNVLTSPASFPAGVPATQLTAILVASNRTVKYASKLSPSDSKTWLVQAIIA